MLRTPSSNDPSTATSTGPATPSAASWATLSLDSWMALQTSRSTAFMSRAVSATGLVHERPGFGMTIRPAPGSVLASPVGAHWDPEPDYFFHWIRDSALVMDAAHGLAAGGDLAWCRRFAEFVAFSDRLAAAKAPTPDPERRTKASFRKYLRPRVERDGLSGDALMGEPRFNPDGTVDIQRWSRPQHDGVAMRAITCLRWRELIRRHGWTEPAALDRLIARDLDFVLRRWRSPARDLWEEAEGLDHYTAVLQLAALEAGGLGRTAAATALRKLLDGFWTPEHRWLRRSASRPAILDIAPVLAVLHAGRNGDRHGLLDERVHATFTALEDHSLAAFPINARFAAAPAMARYVGDGYFDGNPWFLTTLAAAELHYRLAGLVRRGARLPRSPLNTRFRARIASAGGLVARGDAFMATVRALVPADGSMSEQVHRVTGEPVSARHLAWSYAAFLTTSVARRVALGRSVERRAVGP